MSKGTALFLFDYTGIMCQPWLDAGYTCVLVDGQHLEGIHNPQDDLYTIGTWIDTSTDVHILNSTAGIIGRLKGNGLDDVKFVFGFPECTDLAVSGAAHFKGKAAKDPQFQIKAMRAVKLVESLGEYYNCTWALENPVSVISTMWRPPDFYFHPYHYGGYLPEDDVHPIYPNHIKPRDAYPKKTGIWSGNGFIKPDFKPVPRDSGYSDQHKNLGGKSTRTKNIRSATPRGFARAVFEANGDNT